MLARLAKKVFGSKNERELRRIQPIVDQINSWEERFAVLSDEALRAKTGEFRERLDKGETLDHLLPEAFAVVREASKRTLRMRHFDVQLIGGVILHRGRIAEMKTGEGKTLVATLPVYLNALTGKGVHVVTVNDYLARRDAEWMGKIYRFLGMSVGVIIHGLNEAQRREAYHSDITYGQNNEFGFDYLRDNMKFRAEDFVQRPLHYAIVDEVDSILIDEARTPLIISGPAEESTDKYYKINQIIPLLKEGVDYTLDEKARSVVLTEEGIPHVERLLGVENLYDPRNIEILHHVNQALRAHTLFKRDVDYVVKDGQVVIVDEFTGRLMPGRRWSDGLHQAVEAKEGVKIANENQTLASITFQNYFRMYEKLAGMTGTADTEAPEFHKIYGLEVNVIPTNEPMIRIDYPDVIYRTEAEKFRAVIREIEELHAKGQPILVGTTSIEKSEKLSGMLRRRGIPHHVLNAKHHEKEAEIVAQAGRKGAVTISTNMAGRGTDIVLGGNPEMMMKHLLSEDTPSEEIEAKLKKLREECAKEREEVLATGGLHILGTERHESRRIDNQLRGRAGRQGDPGSSRFYLSLEDDLLRIFGSDRMSGMMEKLGMEEDVPIEHRLVTRAIENAQKRVEGRNFEIRKHLLEYDDVMNKQREAIYRQRREILTSDSTKELVTVKISEVVEDLLHLYADPRSNREEWDLKGLAENCFKIFNVHFDFSPFLEEKDATEAFRDHIREKALARYEEREKEFGEKTMRRLEKIILLQTIDAQWKDHLYVMDHLKEGIGLRGYGQRNPLQEYKKEGFELFMDMIARIDSEALEKLYRVQIVEKGVERKFEPIRPAPMTMGRGSSAAGPPPKRGTFKREGRKIGRNEPCPCGSGKKYKKCHGGATATGTHG